MMHNPIYDWVFDLGTSFHTTSHQEIMQSYVIGDFSKVHIADGEVLDVIGVRDVCNILLNRNMWTL